MSVNYASELSPYPNKGVCGLPELFDKTVVVDEKVKQLAQMIRDSRHLVVHTGAGISTAAGIPDFRGPNGVWTMEKQGRQPQFDVTFDEAQPTYTHRALVELHRVGHVKCVITQNVDGLHVRSGFPRNALAELHGNMFVEYCDRCKTEFLLNNCVPTIGQKYTGRLCGEQRAGTGRVCRGRRRDSVLDWEHELPERHAAMAERESRLADVSLTLGTSLRIMPAGNWPLLARKHNKGYLVIVNLQETKHDRLASLIIRARVDDVMKGVCDELGVIVPPPPRVHTPPALHEEAKRVKIDSI